MIGTLKTRVFTQNQQVFRATAQALRQSSAPARVKSRAFAGSFSALSPLASVHLSVGLVAVVARCFVRVETGLVAGAILPKDRFALGDVGLAVVVGGHTFGGALISRLRALAWAWAWARADGLGSDLVGGGCLEIQFPISE